MGNPRGDQKVAARGDDLAPIWAPYAASAVCAVAAVGLRVASGGAALGIAAAVLLAPAIVLGIAYRIGWPLFGLDQTHEVGYIAGCLSALAGWTIAAGLTAWPLAVLVTVSVIGGSVGWLAYGPGKRVASLAGSLGAAAGVLGSAALNPFADAGLIRWALAWAAGTTLAATPFWLHRRIRRQYEPTIDIDPLVAAVTKHLRSAVSAVPGSLNISADGRYSVRLRLDDGKTDQDVGAVIVRIESELSLRAGAIMVLGYRQRRDEVTITVVPEEPTVNMIDRPALPTSITEPAPLGRHDNGNIMMISIYDETGARGAVGGGEKGAGKSRAVSTLMESWTNCDDTLFVFGDLSGGATSDPWMPCIHARVTEPTELKALIDALMEEATARAATLAERGWESWRPSADDPAVIFVIDEAQRILKTDWETRIALENLMQVDRKSGISCFIICPNPVSTEGISPTMREMAGVRLCFRSKAQAVKWVLGDTPAAPVSHVVTEFDKPGQVLGHAPGLDPIPGRAYDTDLAQAKQAAARNAHKRPSPSRLLTPALRNFGQADSNGANTVTEQAAAPARRIDGYDDPQIRTELVAMASGPGVLGQPWPEQPEVPQIPAGRLSTEQALQVAATMLAQPGGTTWQMVARATGRSRSWVFNTLSQWVREGIAIQPEDGRYVVADDIPPQAA